MCTARRERKEEAAGGSALPYFWFGLGIGFVLSATVVIVASELISARPRHSRKGFVQDEADLVEDLSLAVREGLQILGQAAGGFYPDYASSTRERIRYGLDPSGASPSSSNVWYTGEDE